MKLLKDILYKSGIVELVGNTHVAIEKITFDSREAKKHALFVAVKGTNSDGHDFIETAITAGVTAIVCEELPSQINDAITYIQVTDSSIALGIIASNFYDNPSEELKLVGITGTNGKTTIATLMHDLFIGMDIRAGLLSTVKILINKDRFEATHTTPDPIAINSYLRKMVDAKCKYCFMEVSSHGIAQNRIAGLHFEGAAFTNITHDHLDYHGSFNEYITTKKRLFDQLGKKAFALVNEDDKHGFTMLQNTKAKKYGYALKADADYKGKILETQLNGTLLTINNQELWTRLTGGFNAYNITAVFAIADLLGVEHFNLFTTLSTLKPVEGRFEYLISPNGIIGIVDYAHTPDALDNVLKTIKQISTGNEKIITVVGCGGNRDQEKRPKMAQIAADGSHQIILTDDNPRKEDPQTILDQMEDGLDPTQKTKTLRISDRKQAIRTACSLANKNDIILVAGKGHEKYQDINGVKHAFDDLAELKEMFNQMNPS